MNGKTIEYGYINTVNKEDGTVTVIRPDKNRAITGEMPFFAFCGEFQLPKVGTLVAYIKWGTGSSDGVVLGGFWSRRVPPPVGYGFYKDTGNGTAIYEKEGLLYLKDSKGLTAIGKLLEKLEDMEKRISRLEG